MERINKIIRLGDNPQEKSNVCTPYYLKIIDNVKKIYKMQNFPNVNSK